MQPSYAALGENLLRDQRGGAGIGPAAIEREVRDQLDQLFLLHAVVERAPDMPANLVGPAERDERRDGDEAAVALDEPRALPHIAEYDFLGELTELGENIFHLADRRWWSCACHCEP